MWPVSPESAHCWTKPPAALTTSGGHTSTLRRLPLAFGRSAKAFFLPACAAARSARAAGVWSRRLAEADCLCLVSADSGPRGLRAPTPSCSGGVSPSPSGGKAATTRKRGAGRGCARVHLLHSQAGAGTGTLLSMGRWTTHIARWVTNAFRDGVHACVVRHRHAPYSSRNAFIAVRNAALLGMPCPPGWLNTCTRPLLTPPKQSARVWTLPGGTSASSVPETHNTATPLPATSLVAIRLCSLSSMGTKPATRMANRGSVRPHSCPLACLCTCASSKAPMAAP